jgi:DnaJ-class molecular chaperone
MADSEKKTKKICEVCKGNGFVRVPYEIAREEQWADCDFCDSQGEVEVDETRH